MSEKITVNFTLNGKPVSYETEAHTSLLRMLRNNLNWDVKCGCEEGDCGTCTVLINGMAQKSCITLAAQVEGKEVITIKGVTYNNEDKVGQMLQRAFVECGSVQCGFCTPGMILASKAYIEHGGIADRDAIKHALAGNLCRCTGYVKIIDAVYRVAKDLGREVR